MKADRPIRLITLFSGYDSQKKALDYLDLECEHWRTCEWAVKSIQALKDLHFKDDKTDYSKDLSESQLIDYLTNKGISANYNEPMTREQIERLGVDKLRTIYNNIKATHDLVNIQQVHANDLEIVDTDKYYYVMTYSFPCFTRDSLVLTSNGYKKIVDIEKGDYVLSHDNTYHKVVNTFDNGTHDIYSINAMGIDEIKTTFNHRFYVREKYRKGHKSIRCFREPIWKELKDITSNDYLGIAINQENNLVISKSLPTKQKDFWWVIGRYLGDGWIRQQGGIVICCAKDETCEIIPKLDNLGWNYNIVEENTVNKIHIAKKALSDYVEQFGKGAGNKHLTQDVIDLPTDFLKAFLDGYMSADGCYTMGVYKAASISRELIYGIAQCVAKVYHVPYRIYRITPPKTKVIEGRIVNQNKWYQLVFKLEKKKQDKAFYENGYIWYPINSIDYVGQDNVYDIEVEDSHSFTVQNTIVHNCQDLSLAGLGKGMSRDSGTRSGMLWEVERILKELKANGGNLPHILVMENVPQVHGENSYKDFMDWCAFLKGLGYTNSWKDLNSKNYGIPQNRDRTFMVSILNNDGDIYQFPQAVKLKFRLKDVLEKKVDEKYFLSNKMMLGMMNTKFSSYSLENKVRDKNDIAATILARFDGAPQCVEEDVSDPDIKVVENVKPSGHECAGDYAGTFDYNKSETFMHGRDRFSKDAEIASSILTSHADGVVIKEPRICASRGRNPDNPNSRSSGEKLEQRLELGPEGLSNTLTTVQKDNYVIEPTQAVDEFIKDVNAKAKHQQDLLQSEDGVCRTIPAGTHASTPHLLKTVVAKDESLFTDTQAQMFTEDGNVKRYLDSDIVDEFEVGDCADISFPNGYNKGNRVCKQCAPTLNTVSTQSTFVVKVEGEEGIPIKNATQKGYLMAKDGDGVDIGGRMQTHRGTVQDGLAQTIKTGVDVGVCLKVPECEQGNMMKRQLCNYLIQEGLVKEGDVIRHSYTTKRMKDGAVANSESPDCCSTLDTRADTLGVVVKEDSSTSNESSNHFVYNNYRIRKLTPKECWRLMGVKDEDFEKVAKNQSNASLYHLAGDSIVTTCLMAIFGKLFDIDYREKINNLLKDLNPEFDFDSCEPDVVAERHSLIDDLFD